MDWWSRPRHLSSLGIGDALSLSVGYRHFRPARACFTRHEQPWAGEVGNEKAHACPKLLAIRTSASNKKAHALSSYKYQGIAACICSTRSLATSTSACHQEVDDVCGSKSVGFSHAVMLLCPWTSCQFISRWHRLGWTRRFRNHSFNS